jgi:ABC-type glycerol-3-phosphate transport system substrate-binding protein
LLEGDDSPVKGKFAVAPLPGGFGTLGGWHLGLRAGTPRKKEALALLRFLVSKESQAQLAAKLGWNPSRRDAYHNLKGPAAQAVSQALKGVVSRPRVKNYAAFSRRTYDTVNAVLLGHKDPAQAADELAGP